MLLSGAAKRYVHTGGMGTQGFERNTERKGKGTVGTSVYMLNSDRGVPWV